MNKLTSRFWCGFVALPVVLLSVSCAPSPESRASAERAIDYANRSAQEAGQAARQQARDTVDAANRGIEDTNRSVRKNVGDAGITAKVKSLLAADPLVQGFAIDVQTDDGVVTLRGEVKNDTQRRRVLEDAQAVEGVKQVVDQLTVGRA